jgi:hypothetical protein
MAIQDYAPGAAAIPVDGIGKVTVMKQRVDFGTRPLLAADTAKVMEIKAGWDVRKVWSKVITPEAEADTFDLGDSADADNWDNDVPANAAAGTVACSTGGTDAYATAGGKYYAADDYILLTPSAQLSALVIEVAIEVAVPF